MPTIEEICTITAKGQTTVPKAVRQALGVGYGGRIAFRVDDRGVALHALPDDGRDPALEPFLSLLAADLIARPADAVRAIPAELVARAQALADEGGEGGLDAPFRRRGGAIAQLLERNGWLALLGEAQKPEAVERVGALK